ncbi:DUF5710 domain-containing protein [Tissierella praeacuta]|uniref:DUF5710 domain-containing protein n=1 Tax=Tissierella praeacuta TaxID=43131 RepID=UPI003DA41A71
MKNSKLYLKVPYAEKDEAKALGARWDPQRKEWYVNDSSIYYLFAKWYYNREADRILHDYLYIATTNRTCFKCNKQTQVIALVSPYSIYMDKDDDHVYFYDDDCPLDYYDEEENWYYLYSDEDYYEYNLKFFCYIDYLPENFSIFLKDKYNFYYGYSKFTRSYYYGNHCTHCGVLQGDNYLFEEVDSVFNINSIQKAKNITLFKLDLPEAMHINCGYLNSDPVIIESKLTGNHLLLEYSKIKNLII